MTLVSDIIKEAYHLAQVLDPAEETDGYYSSEGLRTLNKVIAKWGSVETYIPSYSILQANLTANVYRYDIQPAIVIATRGHLIDQNNVQSDLAVIDLARFNTLNFALPNQNNRPNQVFVQNDFENLPTKSQLIFYPIPDNTYQYTLYAMQRLASVTYSQDLTTVPEYWIDAITYELAHRLSSINATVLPQSFLDEYKITQKLIKAANKRDKRVIVNNQFQTVRKYRPWGTYVD